MLKWEDKKCTMRCVLTSLFRIWSSVSWTFMRGWTVVKSFHHGQSFTPRFFWMFFCMQRIARSWIWKHKPVSSHKKRNQKLFAAIFKIRLDTLFIPWGETHSHSSNARKRIWCGYKLVENGIKYWGKYSERLERNNPIITKQQPANLTNEAKIEVGSRANEGPVWSILKVNHTAKLKTYGAFLSHF